jgi:hypothetical protein
LGNYYFADRGNNRVRVISPTGNITTVAGGLSTPVPPTTNSKPPTVSTAAGYYGDGLPAIQGQLRTPSGVAIDNIGGTNSCPVAPCIYIADAGNNVVRQVNPNGIMTTFAGIAPACSTSVSFSQTTTVTTVVQTTAGPGSTTTTSTNTTTCAAASGSDGDGLLATQAQLSTPLGVAVDGKGNVYIADTQNFSIREVNATTGILTTPVGLAFGEGRGGDSTPTTTPPVVVLGENTNLDAPVAIASDSAGNLYWAEGCNTFNAWGQCETSRIRRYDAATKSVTTLTSGASAAPTGTLLTTLGGGIYGGDGGASTKSIALIPTAIAIDGSGNVYFSDFTNRVRKLTPIPATH